MKRAEVESGGSREGQDDPVRCGRHGLGVGEARRRGRGGTTDERPPGRIRKGSPDQPAGRSPRRADPGSRKRPARASRSRGIVRSAYRGGVGSHPAAWLRAMSASTLPKPTEDPDTPDQVWPGGYCATVTSRLSRAAGGPASRHGDRVGFGTGDPARCLPHRVFVTAIDPAGHGIEQTVVCGRQPVLDAGDHRKSERNEPEEADPKPIGSATAEQVPGWTVIHHTRAGVRQRDTWAA